VANSVNNDPGGVRPAEDDVEVFIYHKAAEIVPAGGTSGIGMVSEDIKDAL
jgi:hypothetical protein